MDGTRSREALLQFLDYLAAKGLMEKATARSRKAAASKILGILEANEASDITKIDLDDVVGRFGRLHGKEYTPKSLVTYKTRLNSAIDDFKSYLANPLGFRPSLHNRTQSKPKAAKPDVETTTSTTQDSKVEITRPVPTPVSAGNIMPIPIRADLTIYIQGLPFDLTVAEARKIASVITAMGLD